MILVSSRCTLVGPPAPASTGNPSPLSLSRTNLLTGHGQSLLSVTYRLTIIDRARNVVVSDKSVRQAAKCHYRNHQLEHFDTRTNGRMTMLSCSAE